MYAGAARGHMTRTFTPVTRDITVFAYFGRGRQLND